MTMQHEMHPSDERISAFASGDSEATTDAALAAHVSACSRCTALATELTNLRAALAELPDMFPSRPLQLLPPAPARAPSTRLGWLRRLATPALATGAGMVLIGAIGASGVFSGTFMAASGAVPSAEDAEASERTSTDSNYSGSEGTSGQSAAPVVQPGSPETPPASSADDGAQAPQENDGTRGVDAFALEGGSPVWLIVLVAGVALLLGGTVIRFAIQPRAG